MPALQYIPHRAAWVNGSAQPVVAMDLAAALKLSAALTTARVRIVAQIKTVNRRKVMSDKEKAREVASLRADLDTLAAFHDALNQAHEIGGW